MSESVISVSNLSKRYRISHLAGQNSIHAALHHSLRLAWRRLRWNTRLNREEFWALKEVNFDIKKGEIVGIIGGNGAGKSTLLKVLSRITEPTEGRVSLRGRVASLLEVGTGFHPELTGRENIYLNGAILGMSRADIRARFDEIVAFAEVERFLDTPVKRYSSGMYVRLAFSVAAHMEPDILVVDEVLAVGDANFQRKCLGKIQDATRKDGRTVLFVSHNLVSVRQLCSRAILLHQGRVQADGAPGETIAAYMQTLSQNRERTDYRHIAGDGAARITAIQFSGNLPGEPVFPIFETITLTLVYEAKAAAGRLEFFILVHSDEGECVAASFQSDAGSLVKASEGPGRVTVNFKNVFAPGRYLLSAGIFDASRQFHDWVEFAESFQSEAGFANGKAFDQRLGRVSLTAEWQS